MSTGIVRTTVKSKERLTQAILEHLRERYRQPDIEIECVASGIILVCVEHRAGPKYYRVQVTEDQ